LLKLSYKFRIPTLRCFMPDKFAAVRGKGGKGVGTRLVGERGIRDVFQEAKKLAIRPCLKFVKNDV